MKFERGLGKKDIWIKPTRCFVCMRRGTLWKVFNSKGEKAYACTECKGSYKRWHK